MNHTIYSDARIVLIMLLPLKLHHGVAERRELTPFRRAYRGTRKGGKGGMDRQGRIGRSKGGMDRRGRMGRAGFSF